MKFSRQVNAHNAAQRDYLINSWQVRHTARKERIILKLKKANERYQKWQRIRLTLELIRADNERMMARFFRSN